MIASKSSCIHIRMRSNNCLRTIPSSLSSPWRSRSSQANSVHFSDSVALDSLSKPLVYKHFTRDFCPLKSSSVSIMRDILNGAHGYTIQKFEGNVGQDIYLRRIYTILMSYSESLPSHAVIYNPVLEAVDTAYYKPFLMVEQLQPRPSDIYLLLNELKRKETVDVHFSFQVLDFFTVAHLQDIWINEMDSICHDPYSLEQPPVKRNGAFRRVGLGMWFIIAVVALQVLSSILGRRKSSNRGVSFCLTSRRRLHRD